MNYRDKTIIRKRNGEIRNIFLPKAKHLKIVDQYEHDEEEFNKFKGCVMPFFEKYILEELASGEIQRDLGKRYKTNRGSLIAMMREDKEISFDECRQSVSIKMGNILGKAVLEYLKYERGLVDLRYSFRDEIRKIFDNDSELDMLHSYLTKIIVAEFKCNLEVDTEKTRSVLSRLANSGELVNSIEQEVLFSGLVCFSYPIRKVMKYNSFKNNHLLYGYQEFFLLFNTFFSEKKWVEFFKRLDRMAEEAFNGSDEHLRQKRLW